MHTPHQRIILKLSAVTLICLGLVRPASGADDETVQLSPFEVRGKSDNIYSASETNTGTIISKPREAIPFVTAVLNSNLIADLNLYNPSDFATQFAGVARGPGDQLLNDGAQLGAGTSFTVRGFQTDPLYNGFQAGSINTIPDGIARVEVTKGPNSILYGQSSAGGTVNFVPKGAILTDFATTITAGASTNDGYRGSFDTGGAVVGRSGTGFRIGGGYQEFTREQQFYWNGQSFLYGSFRTNLTDKITLEVNAEDSRSKTTPARTAAFVSLGAGTARVTDPKNRLRNDRNFNYHGPWSNRETDAWLTSGYLTARLSSSLTLRLGGIHARQTDQSDAIDGVYGLATGETATGFYQLTTRGRVVNGYKADLLHQATFANYAIDSILGFETHDSHNEVNQLRTVPAVTPITITIPFSRKPVEADYPRPPARSLYTSRPTSNLNELSWTNLRFTQFVTSPEKRWTLMWGAARGEGDNVATDYNSNGVALAEGDDVTYTVGSTYVLSSSSAGKWVAFANTSTSFLIQAGNQQNPSDFTGFTTVAALRAFADSVKPNAIAPQLGEGFEFGVRYARTDGKLRAEVTAFQQERSNIARDFFVRESNVAGVPSEQVIKTFQLASGVEESKGIEVSVDWNPSPVIAVVASALISDGEVTSNVQAPEEVGFQLVNSPEKMWNLWVRYSPDQGALRGFVFGLGATYRNETRTFPTSPDRYRLSDEYTLGRAMVAYAFNSGGKKSKISLNVENLLDEEYVAENGILSEPLICRIAYSLSW